MAYPKNKYRKGYLIFGMSYLTIYLLSGKWVYLRDRVTHPSIILNMNYKTVIGFLNAGMFREAIDQHEEWASREYKKPYPEGIKCQS